MSEEKYLTVGEAIEQGYTHWGKQIHDHQHLSTIENINQADFDDADPRFPIVLAEKEPHYFGVSAEQIREIVVDQIISSEDYVDDTDAIPDALEGMSGWDEFSEKINEVLKGHPYWFLTEIKLTPNPITNGK